VNSNILTRPDWLTAGTRIKTQPDGNQLTACPSRRLDRFPTSFTRALVGYLVSRLLIGFGLVVAAFCRATKEVVYPGTR